MSSDVSLSGWRLLRAAAGHTDALRRHGTPAAFRLSDEGAALGPATEGAAMAWDPGTGWAVGLPAGDARAPLLDLYLPVLNASPGRPIAVGHLGQSLDGFIATPSGDSQFVTGAENLVHLHRMRALCDAVVVGAGTVAADDPQLTTRLVDGPNPLRVVFDPARRVSPDARLFSDGAAPTLYACARSKVGPGEARVGDAEVVALDDDRDGAMTQLLAVLHARGCFRIFVEGGGVTVSAFLEAGLLDRLQIAIAPLLIGDGRPAIRLAPQASLSDCRRPPYRVFRMGSDVLFDCDLRGTAVPTDAAPAPAVQRII
ncbi:MAG: RibD family protein [Vicinamibacterales bacterium]